MSEQGDKIGLDQVFEQAKQREADNGYGVPTRAIEQAWRHAELGNQMSENDVDFEYSGRPLVVIDPGHGAINEEESEAYNKVKDFGGEQGNHEKEIINPVSLALAERLYEKGFDVAFTRIPYEGFPYDYDAKIGEEELTPRQIRAEFAHELADALHAKDVYMISVHANYMEPENWDDPESVTEARGVKGAFVYAASKPDTDGKVTFGGKPADKNAVKLAQSIAEQYQLHEDDPARMMVADMTTIEKFEELGGDTENSQRTSAYIELGFMGNEEDAAALKDMIKNPFPAADQITRGILEFHQEHGLKPFPEDQHDRVRLPRPLTPIPFEGI